MKPVIVELLKKALKKNKIDFKEQEIIKFIEIPPSPEMGDYSFPCFTFAAKLRMDPAEMALELRKYIQDYSEEDFEEIQTEGAYINFFLNKKNLAKKAVEEILSNKDDFGKSDLGKGKKTMVEFLSPNINKPLHFGHLRNMAIGESISRISEFNGEKVIRSNLNNDRGIHICKSMAAYKLYGENKKPGKEKPDHFVGDFYVMFNKKSKGNEELELESHRLLQKWEQGDKKTIDLWKKMNKWVFEGHKKTIETFEISFDKQYYESEIYEKGKEIVLNGVKNKIFEKKEDGSVSVNLGEKLGEKILLRLDGTSVYITQDIYLAKLKFDEFKLDKSICVVGNEQEYHFQVLFDVLKKIGFENKGLKHLSHGMVNLPEGKMKSREGTSVDADDLIEKVQTLVKKELSSREKISKKELEARSLKIALSAIKHMLLKVDSKKNMLFNPKESINFEGDTGPYLLYSYARANSILKKAKSKKKKSADCELIMEEAELAKKLSHFPEIVSRAYEILNPSLIAAYSCQLAQLFNEFYQNCPVVGSENEEFRFLLVKAFMQVMKNATYLLGIEVIDRM
ncbi:MAG: arginine--tRNA ligase [archaeon]